MENAYLIEFIQFSVRMELYEVVWSEVLHIWKLYDKKFWSMKIKNLKVLFFSLFLLKFLTPQRALKKHKNMFSPLKLDLT